MPAGLQVLDLLRDAHLLVRPDGDIVHANPPARRLLRLGDDAPPRLDALIADPGERVHAYLRSCAGTASMLPGAFRLRSERGGARMRVQGAALRENDGGNGVTILLELQLHGAANEQFLLLNQKVEELTREARARREIEAALRASERRFAFLSDASRLLGSSLDYETTLANIARTAVPSFADWAAVDLVGDDATLRRVAIEHADPDKVALVRRLHERYPPDPDETTGVYGAMRSRKLEVYRDIDDALLSAVAVDDEHLRLLRSLQLRSVVIAPLVSKVGVLGTISFAFAESGRTHSDADLLVVEDLANRACVAIENARLVRDISEARDRIESQAAELEHQTDELQNQAAVLEEQAVELETQREEAEAAEQYMRGIVESISDPFAVYDADWRFRYINRAADRRMSEAGRGTAEDLIGTRLWDAWPELVGTRYESEMERARKQRVAVSFDEYNRLLGIWYEVRCYPLPDGGLAVVWKDISDRKRTEFSERLLASAGEILAASLDYETTLVNIARLVVPGIADWCAIDLLGRDGRIQRVVTHHTDPERTAWGRSVQDSITPSIDDAAGIGRVIRTGEPEFAPFISDEALEQMAPTPLHLEIWRQIGFRSAITVPLSVHGRTIGALTLLYADSGRRYGSEDLALAGELARRAAFAVENARLYHEASEANRAKSQFLAVMSHELRTPLNAIIGYEDLLRAGVSGPVTERQQEQLARIRAGADQLLVLINQILSLSRIEAGREEVHVENLDLGSLVAESVKMLAPNADKQGLRLDVRLPDEPITIRSDSGKIRQVLLNLVSNALKFTDAGGVEVRVCRERDGAAVHVSDTGVGIHSDDIGRIFEPFVQADASRTRRHGGTGLGLPVSRELARLLRGEISVESTPGRGSTFSLRLPFD